MNENTKLTDIIESLNRVHLNIDWGWFASALLVSLAAAVVASLMYRFFYERRGTGSQVHRAFPLLAIAITTLFIGVQISIPLSLGLLGSLSIIRFRTPIKEPEEVGFIMLVIASSISAATFNFSFIVILYAVAFLTLLAIRGTSGWRWLRRDGLLVLSLPRNQAAGAAEEIERILAQETSRHQLETLASNGESATWQVVFSGLRHGAPALQAKLETLVGPTGSVNLYLDRPGGIR
ncbi:MAG: DUF4956 domain-containing protein [Kiritimatiellae bacterium]|nr:DUF4956 domain-containing protein [Kiritimatiellia bacterium]